MKHSTHLSFFQIWCILFIVLAVGVSNAEAAECSTNLSFTPSLSVVETGNTTEIAVIADYFPAGLAGYNITVAFATPGIGEINTVVFPGWASLHSNGTPSSASVWCKAVDASSQIEEGATDVELFAFEVLGLSEGNSSLNLLVTRCDADGGGTIESNFSEGSISIVPPTPVPPTNLSFTPSLSVVGVGNTTEIAVVADYFPAGLAGYNITVAFATPGIGEINTIVFPGWASLHSNGTPSNASVWFKAVDAASQIEDGAADVELFAFEVQGLSEGSSLLQLNISLFDADGGGTIEPQIHEGELIVPGLTSTFVVLLESGWNLVSYPVDAVSVQEPEGYTSSYGYDPSSRQYVAVPLTDFEPGKGYWVGMNIPGDLQVTGCCIRNCSHTLYSGWNIAGSLIEPYSIEDVILTPEQEISGQVYGYIPSLGQYAGLATVNPGEGYWISVSSEVQMDICC